MKIILSHDIDHLYWREHLFRDRYIPAYVLRNLKALAKGRIRRQLFVKRMFMTGRLHRIPELLNFYSEEQVKASFFFGMDKALGLSYDYKNTKDLISQLLANGHIVGVHGIETRNRSGIKKEFDRFRAISGLEHFGIRTHYLRLSGYAQELFSDVGYSYDSSVQSISRPYQINEMWELPIAVMDASLLDHFQFCDDPAIWHQSASAKLQEALEKGLPYFVINVHDVYLSDSYPAIREWYFGMVKNLKSRGFEFETFEDAVNSLNTTIN